MTRSIGATARKTNESDLIIAVVPRDVCDQLRANLNAELKRGFDRTNRRYAELMHAAGIPVGAVAYRLFESARPFGVIRNLPVDDVTDQSTVTSTDLSAAVLVGLTHAIGLRHFGYPEEKDGAIIQDVIPIEGWEQTQSNAGRVKFNLHVESPFLPRAARPEAAALLALDNRSMTATRVIDVRSVNALLPRNTIDALRSPNFVYRQDESFNVNGYTLHTPPSPFLKDVDGFEESRCAIFAEGQSSELEEAKREWIAIAEQAAVDVVLEPGDMLVFNNYRCVHGRGPVEGRRWLKRVYGSRDLPLVGGRDLVSVWAAVGSTEIDHSF